MSLESSHEDSTSPMPLRRPSSVARDTCTFADLIRAREEQQRRIREALEEQNMRLRKRLASNEATTATATREGTTTRRRSTGSPKKTTTKSIPIEEFITFVTEMKDLIHSAQEADLVAIHALQDRVEFQNRDLLQRMMELETKMLAVQRPLSLPQPTRAGADVVSSVDDNALQYVLREVEKVRQTVEDTTTRLRRSEETLEQHHAALRLLEKDLNGVEVRLVEAESVPVLVQREASTIADRYDDFTRRVREELEQTARAATRGNEIAREAMELAAMRVNASQPDVPNPPLSLSARLDAMESRLDALAVLHHAPEEEDLLTPRIAQLESQMAAERVAWDVALRGRVEEHLRAMGVTALLAQKTPNEPTPPGDAHRMERLIEEVNGAAAVLSRRFAPDAAHGETLHQRVTQLEARVALLAEHGKASSPSEPSERRTEGFSVRGATSPAGTLLLGRCPPPYAAPFFAAPGRPRFGREDAAERFGPFRSPPVSVAAEAAVRAVAEVRERRRQKEAAAAKVSAALGEIQQRFARLTGREARRAGARREGTAHEEEQHEQHEDPVELLESIAEQKEAVYAKERQLIDLRNTLWREIAQLEEDERELLAF